MSLFQKRTTRHPRRSSHAVRRRSSSLSACCPAIRIDDQAVLEAGEIDDEGPEGMLAAELVTLEPPPAQSAPQATLRIGHGDPQLACFALGHDRENSTCAARPLTLPALMGRAPLPLGAGEGLIAIDAYANIRNHDV